jgi:hypothetical protein
LFYFSYLLSCLGLVGFLGSYRFKRRRNRGAKSQKLVLAWLSGLGLVAVLSWFLGFFFFPRFGCSKLRCFVGILKGKAYRIYRLCFENRSSMFQLRKNPYLLFNDGAHEFRLLTYYVKPEEQIRQLKLLKYTNIQAFGEDGRNISLFKLPALKDLYIYFLSKS